MTPGGDARHLALKLIDYDGMWVPELAAKKSGEIGHANYQHPRRLREATYSLDVDRFPLLLVATSLHALKAKGEALWQKYDNADNLLFKESDLREPVKSPLFYELTKTNDPVVQPLLTHILKALRSGLETTPLLEDVLPTPPALTSSRPSRLGTTAVAPAVPAATPVAPVAPVAAPVVASNGWDFVKSATATSPKQRGGARSAAKWKTGRIAAIAAAALIVVGLLGAWAVWSMSRSKPRGKVTVCGARRPDAASADSDRTGCAAAQQPTGGRDVGRWHKAGC